MTEYMEFTSYCGVAPDEVHLELVVWGKKKHCCMFDKTYESKGWAIRRAKSLLADEDSNAQFACVVKPPDGNFYRVMFGNHLSAFIFTASNWREVKE